MTSYEIVGVVVFGLLLLQTRISPLGAALVSVFWFILIPTLGYFWIKKAVFHKHGPSDKYWELEALGIVVSGAAGLFLYLKTAGAFH